MIDQPQGWPPANTFVELSWRLQSFEAQVLAAEDADVLVCVPPERRGVLMPRALTDATVRWTDAAGLHTRDGQLVLKDDGRLYLEATGSTVHTQRRRSYRAPVSLDIVVEDLTTRTTGWTVDLSEGGARVFLTGEAPPEGAVVNTELELDEGHLVVLSRITQLRQDDEGTEIRLAFGDMTAAQADLVRRQIFTAQVEARRKGQVL